MHELNSTRDPALKSWVESANRPGSDFPIQNLPFAIFRRVGRAETFRGGVAIGDQILDPHALQTLGVLSGTASDALAACTGPTLNPFMAIGTEAWSGLRKALSELLRAVSRSQIERTSFCYGQIITWLRALRWKRRSPPPRLCESLLAQTWSDLTIVAQPETAAA